MSLALLGVRGIATGKKFKLPDRVALIGRHPENDIPLMELHMSRRHFRIMPRHSGFVIEDLGSASGTALNGEQIFRKAVPIQPGDVIDAGKSRFVVIVTD